MEHFDVIVVGAGLSGIGAGFHLQRHCADKTYAILEGRASIGGTWDLFRYPGIRSDSDMYTLGYAFKPWTAAKSIADGPSILDYVRDTAREYTIDQHIRFSHHVDSASWSSGDDLWTLEATRGDGSTARFTCNFLFMCSGYYDYAKGYTPEFKDAGRFSGRIVHPQAWTDDIDYAGKQVVVIGSGATAVTLVPELAKQAAHVVMLQRSPTYVVSAPDEDRLSNRLRCLLPDNWAYAITRWRNVLLGSAFYWFCQRFPERAKAMLIRGVRHALGPDYDVARHFTPSYDPWDQRLCLVPNGDLFDAIKHERASVVTDQIESFTERGIRLRSGAELPADLIVTATGLNLQVLSDLAITVDGAQVDVSKAMSYKGMMISGVPNLAMSMGYTNASWTLKCDLTCEYVCRLLNHMTDHGYTEARACRPGPHITEEPLLDFSSGYVQRAIAKFPKQGSKAPWRLHQNYLLDRFTLGLGAIDDGVMAFKSEADTRDDITQPA